MYPDFVEKRAPEVKNKGVVQDAEGRKLGEHEGIHRFTVGQRGGMGIALGERVYVSDIDVKQNVITLSPREALMKDSCRISDVHWIAGSPPDFHRTYTVQPRYGHAGAPAKIKPLPGGEAEIHFEEPQFALTPGQAAVVYDGDKVLGGGWIMKGRD
jgi:tRNA-specific 2-thiouridylase